MKITTACSCKIKHFNKLFATTVRLYRDAVDFFIHVLLSEPDVLAQNTSQKSRVNAVEKLTVTSDARPEVRYDFGKGFYKFPCYLRRSAIAEAIGKVSSYKSSLSNWLVLPAGIRGREPSKPKAGFIYPVLYKGNMYEDIGNRYLLNIKAFYNNTWDWLTVKLRKSDVDYITRHCTGRTPFSPTLQKRGREWFLDFAFGEDVTLTGTDVLDQTIVAVDLGINSACVCTAMTSGGAVAGRHFLRLPAENDFLVHALNRIKKAQQHGARRTPRPWAAAVGINDGIAVKTAAFIMDVAERYNADVIVFEHLEPGRKARGSRKQRLHMWKAQYVQAMVSDKAHRLGMRISRINAWGTSRLAYDGSGRVLRGRESEKTSGSYSLCEFPSGKVYHCDLNASYNIGARYFIREILKSVPATLRLQLEAKVPQACKRSTCTLSTLISLNAALGSIAS